MKNKNIIEVEDSSCIKAIGYDEDSNSLLIQFNKSPFYAYEGVSIEVFKKLKDHPKKGQFYHQIKNTLPEPTKIVQ
jgi:hypothetical protein